MDPISDILQKRANALDLGRQDELALIQTELDRLFGKDKAHASRLDYQQKTLTIEVGDSSMATIVRYGQVRIHQSIKELTREPVQRFIIRVK